MRRALLLAVLLFAGCAGQQGGTLPPLDQNIQTLLTNLRTVSIADLQNAEAIAVANNDALMVPCYPALIQFVQSFAGPAGTVSGAFSGFETVRVTRMGMMGGLPTYLKLGCAAGVMDEALFITRLGGMLGLATALGPIAPIVAPPLVPAPLPATLAPVVPSAPPAPPRPLLPDLREPPKPQPAAVRAPAAARAMAEMDITDKALALAKVGF